jgi:hypothetical protein
MDSWHTSANMRSLCARLPHGASMDTTDIYLSIIISTAYMDNRGISLRCFNI